MLVSYKFFLITAFYVLAESIPNYSSLEQSKIVGITDDGKHIDNRNRLKIFVKSYL